MKNDSGDASEIRAGAAGSPLRRGLRTRLAAVGAGVLVSGIWASSFVIIKLGLAHTGPLTLAGLRYFTAFLLLLPLMALGGGLRRNPAPGQ